MEYADRKHIVSVASVMFWE